jgi:hypothetical protein
LTIPKGALATNIDVAIESLENTAPGALGESFRLIPDGLAFDAPVTLEFGYADLDLMGIPAEALGIATQAADGAWLWLDGLVIDTRAETVSATTTHFSDYSLVKGFQIRPHYRRVNTGEAVTVSVVYCYESKEVILPQESSEKQPVEDYLAHLVGDDRRTQLVYDDDLAPLPTTVTRIRCTADDAGEPDSDNLEPLVHANVTAWRVNGIDGGTGALGTIAATRRDEAIYTAPAEAPDPDTVTVSADVPWGDKGKLVATALIEIVAGDGYEGRINYEDASAGVKMSGNVRWSRPEPGADTLDGTATLDLQLSSLENNCSLVTPTVAAGGELTLNFPEDGQYHFALTTDAATVSCNGIEIPIAVPWLLCTGWPESPPSMRGRSSLQGRATCDGAQMEWNFLRTGR